MSEPLNLKKDADLIKTAVDALDARVFEGAGRSTANKTAVASLMKPLMKQIYDTARMGEKPKSVCDDLVREIGVQSEAFNLRSKKAAADPDFAREMIVADLEKVKGAQNKFVDNLNKYTNSLAPEAGAERVHFSVNKENRNDVHLQWEFTNPSDYEYWDIEEELHKFGRYIATVGGSQKRNISPERLAEYLGLYTYDETGGRKLMDEEYREQCIVYSGFSSKYRALTKVK